MKIGEKRRSRRARESINSDKVELLRPAAAFSNQSAAVLRKSSVNKRQNAVQRDQGL